MRWLKIAICEALILLFYKNNEVGANFAFFKVEPLKLKVFDRSFVKLS
jgi:hypothetical protein